MGPRAGLDRCGKSRPHRDSIPGPSSPYSVAVPTELPGPQYKQTIMENFDAGLVNMTVDTVGLQSV